jgi:outer membrane protein OmpA-like peptidoglycan-associated protein
MKKINVKTLIIAISLLFLTSCAGVNNQQSRTKEGVLIGAGLGAILGQVIGGDTEATLIGGAAGAALGGLAGNQIGRYMDNQEMALRNALAASESTSIRRSQNVLVATFQSKTFFHNDSYIVLPGAYAELSRVANVLNQYPDTNIRVEGHTDTTGSAQYNLRLSKNRAKAVKNILVQRGVASSRITTIGYGESQPIYSENSLNRRVELTISPRG